jgi:hypothetical protein
MPQSKRTEPTKFHLSVDGLTGAIQALVGARV